MLEVGALAEAEVLLIASQDVGAAAFEAAGIAVLSAQGGHAGADVGCSEGSPKPQMSLPAQFAVSRGQHRSSNETGGRRGRLAPGPCRSSEDARAAGRSGPACRRPRRQKLGAGRVCRRGRTRAAGGKGPREASRAVACRRSVSPRRGQGRGARRASAVRSGSGALSPGHRYYYLRMSFI